MNDVCAVSRPLYPLCELIYTSQIILAISRQSLAHDLLRRDNRPRCSCPSLNFMDRIAESCQLASRQTPSTLYRVIFINVNPVVYVE